MGRDCLQVSSYETCKWAQSSTSNTHSHPIREHAGAKGKRKARPKSSDSPLTLAKEVAGFFAQHFAIPNVAVYGAYRVGRMQEDMPNKQAIVCTVMDARKKDIILGSSRIYLKGSPCYVNKDRTLKQQEARRKQYVERQIRQGKMPSTQESSQDAK